MALLLRVWMVFGSDVDLRSGWLLKMLPFHMDTLLIGAVLALLLRGESAGHLQRRCAWLFSAAAALLAMFFAIDPTGDGRWMPTLGFSLLAFASAGLIGWVLEPDSAAFRVFNLRPLRVLGRYSYGFYVYHLLFGAAWAALTKVVAARLHSVSLGSALVLFLNFSVTFLVAKLSYDLFELRFLRWKQEFSYDAEG